MIRHIYRVQQNPATVFQKQTPSHAAADAAAKSASEKPENTEKAPVAAQPVKNTGVSKSVNAKITNPALSRPQKAPMKSTQESEVRSNTPNKHKKHDQSESVPFSAVILICLIFCILAIVGFFFLFKLLSGDNANTASAMISPVYDHMIRTIGTEMRLL